MGTNSVTIIKSLLNFGTPLELIKFDCFIDFLLY